MSFNQVIEYGLPEICYLTSTFGKFRFVNLLGSRNVIESYLRLVPPLDEDELTSEFPCISSIGLREGIEEVFLGDFESRVFASSALTYGTQIARFQLGFQAGMIDCSSKVEYQRISAHRLLFGLSLLPKNESFYADLDTLFRGVSFQDRYEPFDVDFLSHLLVENYSALKGVLKAPSQSNL